MNLDSVDVVSAWYLLLIPKKFWLSNQHKRLLRER